MYEHKKKPLASPKVYYTRILKNIVIAIGILLISLGIGILGYNYFAGLRWIDSLHNAAMILSGMGPVFEHPNEISNEGKIFSSIYALFSGVVFITNIGFIMAPAVHRFFHKLHLEDN